MAMTEALKLEKFVYASLLDVHKAAEDIKDPQVYTVTSICIATYVTNPPQSKNRDVQFAIYS